MPQSNWVSLGQSIQELLTTIYNTVIVDKLPENLKSDEPAPYINDVDETDVDTPMNWSNIELEKDEEFLGI
jgi:hypothetical protein